MTEGVSEMLSEREAARLLNVSRITLLRRRLRGEIKFFRIGSRVVYSPRHIAEFLRRNERQLGVGK